jgi:hypothetical protein
MRLTQISLRARERGVCRETHSVKFG